MRKSHHSPGAEIRRFPTARRAEAIAVRREGQQCASGSSAVALEGAAAIELYVAEMDRNLDALDAQLALLREAFSERGRLLREAGPGGPADEILWVTHTAPDASGE